MTKRLTPLKAIRAKCLDCSCGSTKAVRECPITDCPLYLYRMGKNPNRAGTGGKGNTGALRKWRENQKTKGSLHEN